MYQNFLLSNMAFLFIKCSNEVFFSMLSSNKQEDFAWYEFITETCYLHGNFR